MHCKNLNLKYSLSANLTARLDKLFTDILEEYDLCRGEVTLVFADNTFLQRLNREYRDRDAPTDVLSFSFLDQNSRDHSDEGDFPVGDIYISVDLAEKQATEAGHSLEFELTHLAIHGLLHLLGYDHDRAESAKKMEGKEQILLASYWQDTTGEI